MNGRRLTPAEREERIKVAREHGPTLAAATFGVSHKATKSLLWRAEDPLPARPPRRAPPSLSALGAEEILDRLLERAERLVVVTAEAEGLRAKVAALEHDLDQRAGGHDPP